MGVGVGENNVVVFCCAGLLFKVDAFIVVVDVKLVVGELGGSFV